MIRLFRFCLLFLLFTASIHAAPRGLPEFTRLVEKQGASVVNISTTQRIKRAPFTWGEEAPNIPEHRPFNDFFQHPFGEGAPDYLYGNSLGSGFIISQDGYILTCAHVVEGASEIIVRLTDRREFSARLVGADRRSDVALLKIDATALPSVVIGDPDKLQVGEWVLAIGSPFGFVSSATSGIVSAKGRSLPSENYIPFIQTDVAINPGNSGGPLFNLKGEVVGVNSQIYSRTGGFMGVSFAIPIDIAMQIVRQFKNDGHVRRGWLGVSLQEVTRGLAAAYGMDKPRGALIADILPNGPAARSELRSGDIVLEYEGRSIERSSDLPPLVGMTRPGARARLKVFRRNRGVQTVVLAVGEIKDKTAANPPPKPSGSKQGDRLGLALSELGPFQRQRQDLEYGVSVKGVKAGPAQNAGLRPGDVILEVDGKRVKDVSGFHRLMAHAPKGGAVVLRIRRGAAAMFLALKTGG